MDTPYPNLAKQKNLGYDKIVRKVFIFVLSILTLFVVGYFSSPKAYATCSSGKDEKGMPITAEMIKADSRLESKIVECETIDTAIGIIHTDPQEFVQDIFKIVLGLSGGIALVLIILSGYKYMASQGNPEAVKSASEGLVSAIIGLLFIIFAFVILQIVGVDILKIPGFSR